MITRLPWIAKHSNKARYLFELIRKHPKQQRPRIEWNDRLAKIATAHCKDMIKHGYFGHTSHDDRSPNRRVRDAGIRLPNNYSSDANNIESLAAGQKTAEQVMEGLMRSDGHRPHLMGEADFYREQTQMGVGYAEGGYYKRYWCVIACHGEE